MTTHLMNQSPVTLPITVPQYRLLVEQGEFDESPGQIELIYGRIVSMNPQGPLHSDPIDELGDWSHRVAGTHFRIRIEKPIEIIGLHSSPEPDIVWATRRRYRDRHPQPDDIHLLIEASVSSKPFDRGEKCRLYAEAGIAEYWIIDCVNQSVEIMTRPVGNRYETVTHHGADSIIRPQCLAIAELTVARLFSDTL